MLSAFSPSHWITMSDAKVRPVAESPPTSGQLDMGIRARVGDNGLGCLSPSSPASSGSSHSPTHPPVSSGKPHSSSFSIDALVGNVSSSEKSSKSVEPSSDLWHSQGSELRRLQHLYYQHLYGESLAAGLKLNSYLTYPPPVSSLTERAAMSSRGPTEHNPLLSYYYNIVLQQKSNNLYTDQYLKTLSNLTNRANSQAERNGSFERQDLEDIRPDSPFNLSQRGADSINASEEPSSQIEPDQSVPKPPSRDPSPQGLSNQARSSQPPLPLSLLSMFDRSPAELSGALPSSGYPALLGTSSESPSSGVAVSRTSPGLYSSFCDYDLLKGKNLLVGAESNLSSPGTPGSQGTLHSPLSGSTVASDLGTSGANGNSAAAVAAAYHLSSMFRKPKRIRTAFSPGQLLRLEEIFEKNRYVVGCERKQLARDLNLSETQIKVWFQNRRTKHKREKHIVSGQSQSVYRTEEKKFFGSSPSRSHLSSSGSHYGASSVPHATSTSSSSVPYLSSSSFSLSQASANAYFKSPTNSPRTLVAN